MPWGAAPGGWRAAVSAAVTLAVLLVPASPVAAQPGGDGEQGTLTYPDTPAGAYYSEPVARLAARGVFAGTLCGSGFCPGDAVDRKTMAVWVVRMLDGQDPAPVSASRFSDVDSGSFYAPFVERLFELEVTSGCGDGSAFCGDRAVTRAQMAVVLSRAYRLPGGKATFADVAVDAWYAQDVARLAASGISRGCGDGSRFCPDHVTTRAQMATFLWRAVQVPPRLDPPGPADADCAFSRSAPVVAASVFQVVTATGLGTAFYIGDGEFVTAAHVIDGAGRRSVRLHNAGKQLEATVKAADFEADIAVLSAPGAGIDPLRLASVRGLSVGHRLGAVGYPVYETPSASLVTGVLSRVEDDETLGTLVQTDAAINPGNSGGPLIDECGNVLGMAVRKLVGSDVEGISYAIASDTLAERLPAVRAGGITGKPRSDTGEAGQAPNWTLWSGCEASGPPCSMIAYSATVHNGVWVALQIQCSVGPDLLTVNFQVRNGTFGKTRQTVPVTYRFGAQDPSPASQWDLWTDPPPARAGLQIVSAYDTPRDAFVAAMQADDSERLHVQIGDELSASLDLSGNKQSTQPVLEACGYTTPT